MLDAWGDGRAKRITMDEPAGGIVLSHASLCQHLTQ